jgi:hypothetical protein
MCYQLVQTVLPNKTYSCFRHTYFYPYVFFLAFSALISSLRALSLM